MNQSPRSPAASDTEKLSIHVDISTVLEQEIIKLKRAQNASLPILQLSTTDILHEIFQHTLRGSIASAYYADLRTLRLVCAHWAGLIDNTPAYWCRIDLALHPLMLATVLAKSKDAPLDVVCASSGYNKYDGAITYKGKWARLLMPGMEEMAATMERRIAFFKTISPLAHRWRTLYFSALISYPEETASIFHDRQAPNLEGLTIKMGSANPTPALFGWAIPLLRHLDVTDLDLVWSGAEFHRLESLRMKSISLSLDGLFGIIGSCPGLQSLVLGDVETLVDDGSSEDDPRPPTPPLECPLLDKLSLEGVRLQHVTPFLRRIHAPFLRALKVKLDYRNVEEASDPERTEATLGFGATMLANTILLHHANPRALRLLLIESPDRDIALFGIDGRSFALNGVEDVESFGARYWARLLERVGPALAARVQHTSVMIGAQNHATGRVARLVRCLDRTLPRIEQLYLGLPGVALAELLHTLATPTVARRPSLGGADVGRNRFLLPRLEKIIDHMSPSHNLASYLKMAANRAGRSSDASALKVLTLRATVDDLVEDGEDPATVEKLRAVEPGLYLVGRTGKLE